MLCVLLQYMMAQPQHVAFVRRQVRKVGAFHLLILTASSRKATLHVSCSNVMKQSALPHLLITIRETYCTQGLCETLIIRTLINCQKGMNLYSTLLFALYLKDAQVWHVFIKRSHSFTCQPHVYLQVETAMPVYTIPAWLIDCCTNKAYFSCFFTVFQKPAAWFLITTSWANVHCTLSQSDSQGNLVCICYQDFPPHLQCIATLPCEMYTCTQSLVTIVLINQT